MRKTAAVLLVVFVTHFNAQVNTLKLNSFEEPIEGTSCRKIEEKLYLNSLINVPSGNQKYIDSLKNCMTESPELFLSLGKYYYNLSDYASAGNEFLKVTTLSSATKEQLGEAYYYLGLASYYNNENDLSYKYSNKALQLGYNSSWAYNNIGLTFYAKGNLDEANEYYKKALRADSLNDIAANNIACNYRSVQNYEIALKYSTLANSIVNGDKASYRSDMFSTLIKLQREEEAYTLGEESYKKFPDDKSVMHDYAQVLSARKKFDEVLLLARKLLRMKPSNGDEWFSIAYIYNEAGKPDSAYYFYRIALKYDPGMSGAYDNIAEIYKILGMFKKAHENEDKCISLDPYNFHAYSRKSEIYIEEHDYENAYAWIMECVRRFPERKGYDLNIGYCLEQLKRYEEAIAVYRKSLIYNPKDDRTLNNTGRCFAQLGQHDSAMSYFANALKINAENSYTYHNRAALYYDMGKYDLACQDLKTAIDKEYNWTIDDKLIQMKKKYCPEVNTDVKILIYTYKGNSPALSKYRFIEQSESVLNESIDAIVNEKKENIILKEEGQTTNSLNTFYLWPNPTKGLFTIDWAGKATGPLMVKVYDMSGNLVLADSMPESSKKEFDLKNNPKGIYVVMVLDKNSVLGTKKIILEN